MPATPWKQFHSMEPELEYVVLASALPLASFGSTLRMMQYSTAVRKQLADVAGLVGYSLDAKPWAKQYFTLSIWDDDGSLRAFVAKPPHVEIMKRLDGLMGATKFMQWTIRGTEPRPTWAEAKQRLG
jgi:hypothetical protein